MTFHTKKDEAEEVVKTIESLGRKAVALPFDSADFQALDTFLADV